MKKSTKAIIITVIVVSVFAVTGAVALAASNISDLENLYLAFRSAQVESAVSNGDMTADEAEDYIDNLTERMEASESDAVPPLRGGRENGMRAGGPIGPNALELYADISGTSIDDIRDACEDGNTTVFALADEAGLLDELKAAMIADGNERIDQLLADGRISQDQADQMKENNEEHINAITADSETPIQQGPMQGLGMNGPGRLGGRRQDMDGLNENCIQ